MNLPGWLLDRVLPLGALSGSGGVGVSGWVTARADVAPDRAATGVATPPPPPPNQSVSPPSGKVCRRLPGCRIDLLDGFCDVCRAWLDPPRDQVTYR